MIIAALSQRLADAWRRADLPRIQRVDLKARRPIDLPLSCGGLLVLDPIELRGDPLLTRTLAGALHASGGRCAFYTEFSSEHMRAVGMANVLSPVALWIAGVDDAKPDFRHRVLNLQHWPIVDEVYEGLQSDIDQLPGGLSDAVTTVFREPDRFFDAADLAKAADMCRRTVDRHLLGHGFATASRVVMGARLLNGLARLRAPGATVGDVAAQLGYSADAVLSRQCRRVLRCRPSQARRLSSADLVALIVDFIRGRSAGDDFGQRMGSPICEA